MRCLLSFAIRRGLKCNVQFRRTAVGPNSQAFFQTRMIFFLNMRMSLMIIVSGLLLIILKSPIANLIASVYPLQSNTKMLV